MSRTLKLPEDMLEEEEFRELPSREKGKYEEKVLEKILDLNQDKGITIPDIESNTYFSYHSISKHLDKLVAKRIAYKVKQGNSIVYHKNGRLIHHIFKKNIDIGDRNYSFKALFDGSKILVFIQENKKSPLGTIEEGGGIIVPLSKLNDFAERVRAAKEESPKIKKKMMKIIE